MKWYLLKLVYQVICGDGKHRAQFDEQLRLIQADDRFHAFTKGRCVGESEQENFYNCDERLVQWKFLDVTEIHVLENLADGAELYSRINEVDDAAGYNKMLATKANNLFQEAMQQSLNSN